MKVRFAVTPPARSFDAEALLGAAVAIEAFGFDTLWLSDVPLAPIGDPLISLAGIATRTTRLKLGANVVPIGRNAMVLARQLAQLDRLSGGRLLLSFVPGLDQPGERPALGFPSGDRWARIEADIDLLRRWWAGETVDGAAGGTGEVFEGIEVEPTPVQDPLEIWLGGAGPRGAGAGGALRRRVADGHGHPDRGRRRASGRRAPRRRRRAHHRSGALRHQHPVRQGRGPGGNGRRSCGPADVTATSTGSCPSAPRPWSSWCSATSTTACRSSCCARSTGGSRATTMRR